MELETLRRMKNTDIPIGKYIFSQKIYWGSKVKQKAIEGSEIP